MTDLYGIALRQPQAWDVVGRRVAIAALGTAFEAGYGWVIRTPDGVLAEGSFTAGAMGLLESFVHEAPVATDYVGEATFELSGEEPEGNAMPAWIPNRWRSS